MGRSRIAIVGQDDVLERDIQIAEESLPSWLTETALKTTYATMEELNARAPLNGSGFVLSSPDGKSWSVTVNNDGSLSTTSNEV